MPSTKFAGRSWTVCAVWTGAPRQQRKRSKQIEAAITECEQREHRSPTEEEIAAQLGVPLEQYYEWLVEVRGLNLGSLEDAPPDEDNNRRDLLQFISDDKEEWPSRLLERSELQRLLADAISKMPDVEKTVLSLYYYEELTLREKFSKIVRLHECRGFRQLKSQALSSAPSVTTLDKRLGRRAGGF